MDVNNVQEKSILPKPFVVLFTIVQVICGVDYGYVNFLSKKWGVLLKVIAIAFSLVNAVYLCKSSQNLGYGVSLFYYLSFSAEYLAYTLILSFSSYSLYEYLFEFGDLGSRRVNRNISKNVVNKALLFPFISVLFKTLAAVISNCVYNGQDGLCALFYIEFVFVSFSSFAFDSLVLVQYLIMYTYYRHMGVLKSKVIDHELSARDFIKTYRNILDAVDKIKPVCDKLIMSCVIIAVPRYMATEFMVLSELKSHQDWVLMALQYSVVLEAGFLMLLPSLTAEAVNSQTDEILLTFHNDLVDTVDEQKRLDIKEAIRYMGARPSQYYVWRRVPVDMRLPMALVSIMTTYLIVIIQFTHLFD